MARKRLRCTTWRDVRYGSFSTFTSLRSKRPDAPEAVIDDGRLRTRKAPLGHGWSTSGSGHQPLSAMSQERTSGSGDVARPHFRWMERPRRAGEVSPWHSARASVQRRDHRVREQTRRCGVLPGMRLTGMEWNTRKRRGDFATISQTIAVSGRSRHAVDDALASRQSA